MLLRIIKSNPLISLALPVLLAASLWGSVYFVHGPQEIKSGIPMFEVFFRWVLNLPALATLIGLGLLILEAYLWNGFINKQSLLKQSSYLTATFYLLLYSCRPLLISFYPSMFASLFLILALRSLAESYKKERALAEAFDAGIFIGLASLLYFPLIIFILFLWIGLLTMRSIVWREWVVSLVGFILPFGFALGYYAVFYTPEKFWYEKLIAATAHYNRPAPLHWQTAVLLGVVALAGIVCFFFFMQKISDNVVKNQKISALIIWFVCFSICSILLSPAKDARAFTLLVLPCSFVFANYFTRAKRKFIPELLFIMMLGAIVINIFF